VTSAIARPSPSNKDRKWNEGYAGIFTTHALREVPRSSRWYFLVPLRSYYFPSITLTRILFRFCPCKFPRLILIPPSRIPSPNPSALQSHSSFIASLSRSGFYAIFCWLTFSIIRSRDRSLSLFFSEGDGCSRARARFHPSEKIIVRRLKGFAYSL